MYAIRVQSQSYLQLAFDHLSVGQRGSQLAGEQGRVYKRVCTEGLFTMYCTHLHSISSSE